MQTTNLKFISRSNALYQAAISASPDFPDLFCEAVSEEFSFHSVLLFRIVETSRLQLLGKSSSARKALTVGSYYDCGACRLLKPESRPQEPHTESKCSVASGVIPQNEVCMTVHSCGGTRYLVKLALHTPVTPGETDFLKLIAGYAQMFLNEWGTVQSAAVIGFGKAIYETANELRTPTNSILGFASLLSDDQLSSSQKEYVSTLKENAQRLLSTINEMIEFSKSEAGNAAPSQAPVQIVPFFDELVSTLTEKMTGQGIALQKTVEKSVPAALKTDPSRLKSSLQTYIAVLSNALASGTVFINVSCPAPEKLVIKLFTSGTIHPISQLAQLLNGQGTFDVQYQKVFPLSSLSVPHAKKNLELIGSSFETAVSAAKGISVTVQLPMEALNPLESKISNLPKPEGKSPVLVIEDDYATSKLLSNYLNKWGYSPHLVNSGLKALELLKKEKFLAVIMDIVLPDVNGLELLKKIHEDENSKYIPVIVCSVEAEQQKAFLMGAVEYFVKPIRYKDLVEVLTSYKLKKDSNVLCVDDDVPTLNLVKGAIESVGFNAIALNDSTKVIDAIKDVVLDLAIVDLDMPEINGFQLIKLIKSQPRFANLPIIIYTGKENFDEDLKNIDGLFTDLLSKRSTRIEDLADTINAMINRYEQPSSPEEVKTVTDEPKILLVEDYKHSQIIVTRLLKKNGFNSVMVVENGQEALDQVKTQAFDLVLMDMQMPVMNGFEATERIRQLPEYKATPIIALTAFAMKGDKEKCLEAGATDYIPKPIDSVEFIEKVRHYTSR